jgi:hypothetical protein
MLATIEMNKFGHLLITTHRGGHKYDMYVQEDYKVAEFIERMGKTEDYPQGYGADLEQGWTVDAQIDCRYFGFMERTSTSLPNGPGGRAL